MFKRQFQFDGGQQIMNVFKPETWNNLDCHPVIKELGDKNWRENFSGEVGDDPDARVAKGESDD